MVSAEPAKKTIIFDCGKGEPYTPTAGLSGLARRLRPVANVLASTDTITDALLRGADLFALVAPRAMLTADECSSLRAFVSGGGALLVALAAGGEAALGTNVNFLLEEFGLACNADAVVRTVYCKYLHPREVLVQNGVVNRAIDREAGKAVGDGDTADELARKSLVYVYPHGASLTVQAPAVPVLSSGHVAYPLSIPTAGVYHDRDGAGGRILCLGSSMMLSDDWVGKEENGKLADVLFRWCLGGYSLNQFDMTQPDVADLVYVPDTADLANRVRCCLQESEQVPRDPTTMFDATLFKFDTSLVPEAIALYRQLEVEHEPLSLIPPTFSTPTFALQPATIPPPLRELPPPKLELFDLDDHLASAPVRLAQLTNKCNAGDLEYYVREAGRVLGITSQLAPESRTARDILAHVFRSVVGWRKLNQGSGVVQDVASFDPVAAGSAQAKQLPPMMGGGGPAGGGGGGGGPGGGGGGGPGAGHIGALPGLGGSGPRGGATFGSPGGVLGAV
jgi:intraflagellar transport protein 52